MNPPFSIYLAGSSKEGDRVRHWESQLRGRGVRVASAWSEHAEAWSGRDASLSPERQRDAAMLCMTLLINADAFWLLFPQRENLGAMVELGVALGRGMRVYVSGPGYSRTVFTSPAVYRDPDDHLTFCEITRFADSLQPLPERTAQNV